MHEKESRILFVAATRRKGAFKGKSNLSVRVLGKLALGEKIEHL